MNSEPSGVKIWSVGCLLVVVAVFVFLLSGSSTSEFWHLGVFGFIIFGLPLFGITVLGVTAVVLVAGWLVERRPLSIRTQRLILLLPWLVAAAIWIASAAISATPRSRFAATVIRPVPSSVQDIKVAGLDTFLARRWLFTFTIGSVQIGEIVNRHALIKTNAFDLQKIIDGDSFLKRVAWARNVSCDTNGLFYSRMEASEASSWTYFVVDTNSAQAWFLTGFQN